MNDSQTDRIALENSYPLHQIGQLKARLVEAIRADTQVEVSTENLTEAPLGVLQVLYAAQKLAAEKGCDLTITCPEGGILHAGLMQSGFDAAMPHAPCIEQGVWNGLSA